jgi:excinuclease ABC subunit A
MVFMEDLFLPCEICEGKRFKPEVLEVRYKSKNVHEILQLTVTQARQFFAGENRLVAKLKVLEQVGLGYLRLGQSSNTLSGGESQRLKIARELCMAETQGTLYVLDEPTTGLHFRDVAVLSRVLHQLVENGNTVVVIEHNLEVMKSSDWIIDFGPEGGDQGGKIVFEGTPEDMVKKSKGHTARYLKPVLEKAVRVSVPEYLGESL